MSMSDVEKERAANRAAMPETARFLDELRAVFGPVRVVWASENGHVVGCPPVEVSDAKEMGVPRD